MATHSSIKVGKRKVRKKTLFVVDLRSHGIGQRFFKKKKDAESWAEEKENEVKEHGRKSLLFTDVDRLELSAAREKLKPLGATLSEAVDFFCAHRVAQVPKLVWLGVGECIKAKRRSEMGHQYLIRLESVLGSFVAIYGAELIHNVSQSDIEHWLNRQGWQAVTRKYNLKDLSTFFGYAIKHGWTKVNPCKNIEPISVGEFSKGILTPEQTKVFLDTCEKVDAPLLRYFSDQLFGGLREDEAANLKESQSEPSFVHLTDTKTGSDRFNEYNPTWTAWRRGIHAPIVNLRKRVDAVKSAAKSAMLEKNLIDDKWWYPKNCLRHSFCSYAAPILGASKAADLAGHSEKIQKKHYRRPIPKEVAEKFWKILP